MAGFSELLGLQELDTKIDQLKHRVEHDELHAQVVADESVVAEKRSALEQLEAQRYAVDREQRRWEDEASVVEEKVAHLNESLYDGSVGAHKDLEAIQHEIAQLKERQAGFEDNAIVQMELAEPLDEQVAAARAELAGSEQQLENRRSELTVLLAELEVQIETVSKQRTEVAASIDPAVIETYENKRRQSGGQGAAKLAPGGLCEGCHLTLARADYDKLKHAPADEMVLCPECDRILVR